MIHTTMTIMNLGLKMVSLVVRPNVVAFTELCHIKFQLNLLTAKKKQGKQCRTFQRKWFLDHKWLSYCVTQKVGYCFYCRKMYNQGELTFNKRSDGAFIFNGFSNWKKARQKFKEHENSQCHREACMMYAALRQPSVVALARTSGEEEQQSRRSFLLKQLSSIQYLVRQGLAIRGHCDIEGNLQQLMKCRAEDIPRFQQWIKQGKYQSPEIVNELIRLMARQVLNSILNKIRTARIFALIADETRDFSGKEQLSVSIRWVDDSYERFENFVGLVDVEKSNAITLKTTIKDVLIRCNIPLSSCRGQAYDGAANMAGYLNGVAVKIQSEEPSALFVHCLGHSVNLCLQECGKIAKCIRDAISIVRELYNITRMSPKRLAQFNHLKAHALPNSPSLKPLCPTRWTVRTAAINSVLQNYSILLEELEVISSDSTSTSEASTKATGLIAVLEKFSTFFGLKLAYLVFVATEQLATTLQAKDMNAQVSIKAAKRYRNLDSFNTFFQAVVAESDGLTSKPALPHQRRVPKRIDDGACNHTYQSVEEYFRQQYYEVLDIMRSELKHRFDKEGLKVLGEIESLLISACNGNKVPLSTQVQELYHGDIDFQRLEVQLSMLPELVKTVNEQNLSAIDTLTTMMNTSKVYVQ